MNFHFLKFVDEIMVRQMAKFRKNILDLILDRLKRSY